MKELKKKVVYNEQYDININVFLSEVEIEKIAKTVIELQSYVERQQMICYMTLNYCTDIGRDVLDEMNPDDLVCSGLWELVKDTIYNFYGIEEAIKYYESPVRILYSISEMLPELTERLRDVDLRRVFEK